MYCNLNHSKSWHDCSQSVSSFIVSRYTKSWRYFRQAKRNPTVRSTVSEAIVRSSCVCPWTNLLIYPPLQPKMASLERIHLGRDIPPRTGSTQTSVGLLLKRFWSTAFPHFWLTSSQSRKAIREHMLNWGGSTPLRLFSSCFWLFSSHSFDLAGGILFMWPSSCQQGGLAGCRGAWDVKMLFLGVHGIQKRSSGENKSCHTQRSVDAQWVCNQVMLLCCVLTKKRPCLSKIACCYTPISVQQITMILWLPVYQKYVLKRAGKAHVCVCRSVLY